MEEVGAKDARRSGGDKVAYRSAQEVKDREDEVAPKCPDRWSRLARVAQEVGPAEK